MTQATTNRILEQPTIQRKLRRMAYEIYERNADEQEIILAGIRDAGQVVAAHLAAVLKEIAPFTIRSISLSLDKQKPKEVQVSEEVDFTNKVVILVDDVANSGRTLLYAMKPILANLPRKIQTAVLIDRSHKTFPISADYIGFSLSTTLQDHVMVEITEGEILAVYLK